MRFGSAPLWLAVLQIIPFPTVSAKSPPLLRPRDYDSRDYYALHLTPDVSPKAVAQQLGLTHEGVIGELSDHHLFSTPTSKEDVVAIHIDGLRRKRRSVGSGGIVKRGLSDGILFAEKQRPKKLVKRVPPPAARREAQGFDPAAITGNTGVVELQSIMQRLDIRDPIFHEQWHLFNPIERHHDVNVTGLWLEGITGENTTVAIVDDGLDMDSQDLAANYFAAGSYDFNDHAPQPKPRLSDDRHGTRCAGEIAAVRNNVCGVGVAYDAKVAGIRMLSKPISDADEAIALNYAYHENQIYSCSWGPPDDGQAMDAPGILIKRAMVKGVQEGRNGKGSIFVFASGNGATYEDNCNFDGYTNSIYSITIGAIDRNGKHPYYSEQCSANMAVTYSSGSGDAIHTTDVGLNQCFNGHGGTSAAAPLAAGIFALVLSVRPGLTWRDMQYLALKTAVPINEKDPDWKQTATGKMFNHKYGYGKIDAWAIVHAAKDHKLVKPQAWYNSPVVAVNATIPEGTQGLQTQIKVTAEEARNANLGRLEHVTVTMNAAHSQRGDMSVDLISPKGIVSHIATTRKPDTSKNGYKDWTFMSVKHWGEEATGTWTIIIKDTVVNEQTGSLIDWSLTLWGEAIDADKAKPLPLPGGDGDKNLGTDPIHTTTAQASTTELPSMTSTADPSKVTENPSDHADRPVNEKPGSTVTSTQLGTGTTTGTTTTAPTSTATPGDQEAEVEESNFLPSFFPTFGVSAKTQVWIYGAFVVIILFVGVLATYLSIQKKRAKKQGMDYEFEALNNMDDLEGGAAGAGGKASGGGRRKARDLYDAFGASDDEEDILSEKEYDDDEGSYDDDEALGIDEGPRVGDRAKLLGRDNR
ncbi:peptidase S8/S53 domain-containing protein [Tuber brumale]|nr:peptidase S8/S53 domain-containing protein [Tuber brumale]